MSAEAADAMARAMQDYWDTNPAKLGLTGVAYASPAYFARVRDHHLDSFAFSNSLIDWPSLKAARVLDIYHGIAIDALMFAQAGADVTHIAPTQKLKALAEVYFQQNSQAADIRYARPQDLALAENSYDLISARAVFMFEANPGEIVTALYRSLKPGGFLLAHFLNRHSWYPVLAKASKTPLIGEGEDPPYIRLDRVKEIAPLFRSFSNTEIYYDRFPTKTTLKNGLKSVLYNDVLVPVTQALPKPWLKPFGYYIVIMAQK